MIDVFLRSRDRIPPVVFRGLECQFRGGASGRERRSECLHPRASRMTALRARPPKDRRRASAVSPRRRLSPRPARVSARSELIERMRTLSLGAQVLCSAQGLLECLEATRQRGRGRGGGRRGEGGGAGGGVAQLRLRPCRRPADPTAGRRWSPDESIRWTTDWECWIRLILSGSLVGLVDAPLATYRLHQGSLSSQRRHLLAGRVRTLEKTLRRTDLSPADRRVLIRSIKFERADSRGPRREPPFSARRRAPAADPWRSRSERGFRLARG